MIRSVLLADRRLLVVTGPDRISFLQGQMTQDMATVEPGIGTVSGWADPKGRLIFAGHLFGLHTGAEESVGLLVPAELAEVLLKRLRMYVLRAKAVVALSDLPILGLFGPPPTAVDGAVRLHGSDGRHLLLGHTPEAIGAQTTDAPLTEWDLAEIRAGIPGIVAATTGEFVPQMVNLDLLGGISFTKGCYTGQEIVARIKYLGRLKRRMLRFAATDALPLPGMPLYAASGAVGQVVSAAPVPTGTEFLAVILLDSLPGPYFLDESLTQPVQRLELPYEVPVQEVPV